MAAGLPDLGGSDPLSLIRFFGNGSYVRYSFMGLVGCTLTVKAPPVTHRDIPVDPTYYSTGDLEIHVDLARVPPDASDWFQDDGKRLDMSLAEAVHLLNTHVAAYYRRISENQLRITFREGEEFEAPGDGSPTAVRIHQFQLFGACLEDCALGAPGAMNRILLNDVAKGFGGSAYNGGAFFGLASFEGVYFGTLVHEIGHAWMAWPHSYAEVPWRPTRDAAELDLPNPYSNRLDMMSDASLYRVWDAGIPSTLAINRYAAGWIRPEDVALHLEERATYTLAKPRRRGYQFLVLNSGRRGAFTTLEVLDDFPPAYRRPGNIIRDVSGRYRLTRYEGVFVARYDQTRGTGINVRVGPALYNADNPHYLTDVGRGYDDYSLIPDGEERDIGGGITVAVSRNRDGSYEVTVTGGRTAAFEPWCAPIRALPDDPWDTGCFLDTAVWE